MSKIAKQAEHNGKETWGIWLKKIIQICNEIIPFQKSNLNVKNLRSDCKKLLKEKKSAFQNQMGHLSEMVNGGSFIIFK